MLKDYNNRLTLLSVIVLCINNFRKYCASEYEVIKYVDCYITSKKHDSKF